MSQWVVEENLLVVLSCQGNDQVACFLYPSRWLKVGERTLTNGEIGPTRDGLMCAGCFMQRHRCQLDLVLRCSVRAWDWMYL